jgi:hypothetical protein
MQGRFTGADEIWKDSHVNDPQSWNKLRVPITKAESGGCVWCFNESGDV